MAEAEISEEVRSFLRDHIESFEQLEILLLLCRTPDQTFVPDTVSEKLGISNSLAEDALAHLARHNLLEAEVGALSMLYHYPATSAELRALVDQLARDYSEKRLDVMRLMSSHAIERVRTRALRTFADAFLVGQKKDKDG